MKYYSMDNPFSHIEDDNDKIKSLYTDPVNLVVIEFANRTNIKKVVWVEPTCVELEIDAETEYQIVTHDRTFRIEFDEDEMIFYLQYSFGFILNKRPTSPEIDNPNPWTLDFDYSDKN